MQIVLRDQEGDHDVDLTINSPAATVADLTAALSGVPAGGAPGAGLLIGEHRARPDLGLAEAGLFEGAVVRTIAIAPAAGAPVVHEVRVIGGLDAGRTLHVDRNRVVIGRHQASDVQLDAPTVSRAHCRLTFNGSSAAMLEDLGSQTGTWVNGSVALGPTEVSPGSVIEVGNVLLTFGPPLAADRARAVDPFRNVGPAGTISFNRPPRSARPGLPDQLTVPASPGQDRRAAFSFSSLLAPLVFAAATTIAFHNPLYALFAVMSPVMVLFNYLETRTRSGFSFRRRTHQLRAELDRFDEGLIDRKLKEVARRRDAHPHPAEIVRRATLPSIRLWERRPGHEDFLRLSAGLADLQWQPPLADQGTAAVAALEVLERHRILPMVPAPIDLSDGGVLGIVGDRSAGLALARSVICQAATLHGPADLELCILAAGGDEETWDWAKWLPHARDVASGGGARLLAAGRQESDSLLKFLIGRTDGLTPARDAGTERVTLYVIDDLGLMEGRSAMARAALRGAVGPSASIVLAPTEEGLPAVCNTIVDVRSNGEAVLRRPQAGEHLDGLLVAGMSEATARECARALARFEDPELDLSGAGLPDEVRLLPLLDLPELSGAAILDRWRSGREDPGAATVLGVTEEGPFVLDLVNHGPHGLIGGTTGSGKSELLRSLVVGLSVSADPDHLTSVLIDYKGGTTFRDCAGLPQVVGLVTDLDEELGERALTCLEAELRHRERVIVQAGAADLAGYLALARSREPGGRSLEPVPRLLVIVDEFKSMVKELPEFVDSLVGVAMRGRALGVHLLLATQRPSDAVNAVIKSNTRIRIALQVEDEQDSRDVVEVPDAVSITRRGRAYVRLRAGRVVPIQTALVSGTSGDRTLAPVEARPFRFGRRPGPEQAGEPPSTSTPTDVSRLVEAVGAAFAALGNRPPRRPWPEPLPADLTLDVVLRQSTRGERFPDEACATVVPFALADDPMAQDQYVFGWDLEQGNLLMYGIAGSGTTTALSSLALVLADRFDPDQLHLYVLDCGAGELEVLHGLPHTGAYVGADEEERQIRLVRHLLSEVNRRRGLRGAEHCPEPTIVLLLANYGGLAARLSGGVGLDVMSELVRVVADGPDLRVYVAATADRRGAVPGELADLVRQKLLFRMGDANDYGLFGISKKQVPSFSPGRALVAETGQVIQVGCPQPSLRDAVAVVAAGSGAPARQPPSAIDALPAMVHVSRIESAARLDTEPLVVPIGVGDRNLAPAALALFEGDHALVAGPARSGKSTVLCSIAAVLRHTAADLPVIGVALRRSPLRSSPELGRLVTSYAELADALPRPHTDSRTHVLLIDDAELIDDADGLIADLIRSQRTDLHVIAAGRADALRALYGHWTQALRRSKIGFLIKPEVDLDGDLLGVKLPRRHWVSPRTGRGYLVNNGEIELVQSAVPAE
jgi:DNA segregation ATPase FtsK/SpoIIIE, S-DNA-T family